MGIYLFYLFLCSDDSHELGDENYGQGNVPYFHYMCSNTLFDLLFFVLSVKRFGFISDASLLTGQTSHPFYAAA
jgi:hypothetical protein